VISKRERERERERRTFEVVRKKSERDDGLFMSEAKLIWKRESTCNKKESRVVEMPGFQGYTILYLLDYVHAGEKKKNAERLVGNWSAEAQNNACRRPFQMRGGQSRL
jgi:hypothetical protein